MERRKISLGLSIALAIWLTACALSGWLYLQRGYDLGISMSSAPGPFASPASPSVYHVSFPVWRLAGQLLVWLTAMAALGLTSMGRQPARALGWTAFGAAVAIGGYDVIEYGSIASPTSIWSLFSILAVAVYAQAGPRLWRSAPAAS